ncbi:response regulator, partial [bacterium]|nr:response regulator [bacterium]
LSTSYAIIKKHDGNIFVESKPGAGSVFNIYLPANREKVSIKYISEEETVAGAGRIVIMDDDVLVRESLGEILTAIGYIVDFASNGKEVIDIYKNAKESNDPVDAVIMDLTIPGGMGGKETISELIKIDPNVKAVVSSGYSNDPVMADFRKFGFSGVLKKPYKDIAELSRLLSKLTARP